MDAPKIQYFTALVKSALSEPICPSKPAPSIHRKPPAGNETANQLPPFYGLTSWSWRLIVGSQAAQPHLKDGATYCPRRPTTLDKIKNFHLDARAGPL